MNMGHMCNGKTTMITPLTRNYKREKWVKDQGLEKLGSERQRENHREILGS